jgi:hypothetical protein
MRPSSTTADWSTGNWPRMGAEERRLATLRASGGAGCACAGADRFTGFTGSTTVLTGRCVRGLIREDLKPLLFSSMTNSKRKGGRVQIVVQSCGLLSKDWFGGLSAP